MRPHNLDPLQKGQNVFRTVRITQFRQKKKSYAMLRLQRRRAKLILLTRYVY